MKAHGETAIKSTLYVEANVMNSFSFMFFMASEENIFEYILANFCLVEVRFYQGAS